MYVGEQQESYPLIFLPCMLTAKNYKNK